MAFGAGTCWEVQTGGDDTNFGGGFDTSVAGFPTDGTVDSNTGNTATPVFSSASYNFQAGDVGAWIFIKSGTNSYPGWYKITAVGSNKATLNAAVGAAVLVSLEPSVSVGIASSATPTSLTWGIDYSQTGAARFSSTHLTIGNPTTTQLTDADNTIGKNWVGNIISITSGSPWTTQRVVVTSTSGTTATVDKSLGTAGSTGGAGKLGGCLASIGQAGALRVNGNAIFVKTGVYTITSASTNVSGGCLSISGAGNAQYVVGYGTLRGDFLSPPTLQLNSGVSSATIMAFAGGIFWAGGFILDGNNQTTSLGLSITTGNNQSFFYKFEAKNCTNSGITQSNNVILVMAGCSSHNNTGQGFNIGTTSGVLIGCVAYSNSTHGFTAGWCIRCIAYSNSQRGFTGVTNLVYGCVSYGHSTDRGFSINSGGASAINCIAEGNSVGFNYGNDAAAFLCNASYNNTTVIGSATGSIPRGAVTPIALSSSPFVNAAGGNFALNNISGAGALLRAAGFPSTFPDGVNVGYFDIGAIQARWPMVPMGIKGTM